MKSEFRGPTTNKEGPRLACRLAAAKQDCQVNLLNLSENVGLKGSTLPQSTEPLSSKPNLIIQPLPAWSKEDPPAFSVEILQGSWLEAFLRSRYLCTHLVFML